MKIHTLSDGTTIKVKVIRELVGTRFVEIASRKRTTTTIMRIDGPMYLVTREQLVPISHPSYGYASTDIKGAELALAFFVDSAESCIAHAAEEGIDVSECYSK